MRGCIPRSCKTKINTRYTILLPFEAFNGWVNAASPIVNTQFLLALHDPKFGSLPLLLYISNMVNWISPKLVGGIFWTSSWTFLDFFLKGFLSDLWIYSWNGLSFFLSFLGGREKFLRVEIFVGISFRKFWISSWFPPNICRFFLIIFGSLPF